MARAHPALAGWLTFPESSLRALENASQIGAMAGSGGSASGGSGPTPSKRYLTIWARLLLAFTLGSVGAWLAPPAVHVYPRLLLAWNAGVMVFIVLLTPVIRRGDPADEVMSSHRVSARSLATLVATTLASLLATGFMLADLQALPAGQRFAHVGLSVLALVGAWFLNNITFGLRYADLYYLELREHPNAGPVVDFQGAQRPPLYWDFMYLAFAIGMTFGVTDTALLSSEMRRLVLGHSLLSFWFNTVILALSLNLVAALL